MAECVHAAPQSVGTRTAASTFPPTHSKSCSSREEHAEEPIPHRRKTQRRGEAMKDEEWRDLPFNMRVKDLCKPCNNEWCNEIETAAPPIVEVMAAGQHTTLGPADQMALATWVTLMVLMLRTARGQSDSTRSGGLDDGACRFPTSRYGSGSTTAKASGR